MTAADTPLDVARRLDARGLCVIPVPRPRPGVEPGHPGDGKTPSLPWKRFQSERPTDRDLVRWFGGRPMNLAIVTGAISGVVMLDADTLDGLRWCTRNLPYTPWQTETARGFHLAYRHPGARVTNRARLDTRDGTFAIDVRGDGGFVIAPGSVHASGAEYQFAGDWTVERDALPVFRPAWLQRPTTPSRPTLRATTRPTGDVVERARRYLAAIPAPEIGAGSDARTLYAACRLVRGFGLDAADAEDLLWSWAGGRAGWSRAWIARKVQHAERYGREVIGGLR